MPSALIANRAMVGYSNSHLTSGLRWRTDGLCRPRSSNRTTNGSRCGVTSFLNYRVYYGTHFCYTSISRYSRGSHLPHSRSRY